MSNDFPRRICIDKNTAAELAIRSAVKAVEESGRDPLLTDAVVLLEQARNKVADFVDARIARGDELAIGVHGAFLLGKGEAW